MPRRGQCQLDSGRLADALGLLVSHEACDHLTEVCGWPHEEYVVWASAAQLSLDWP